MPVQTSGLQTIQYQWVQILQQTKDLLPGNYDGDEDFVIQSNQNQYRCFSLPNDTKVKIKNLVICGNTYFKSKQITAGKRAKVFCDKIYLMEGWLKIVDVDLYARNIILMSSKKQFGEALEALSKEAQLHEPPKESAHEMVYFPPGTVLLGELNVKFLDGLTSLMVAAQDGNEAVYSLLMAAKADIEVQNRKGWRALHCAVKQHRLALVNLLLNAKAQVNAENLKGNSPLALAAKHDYPEIAQSLLIARADPVQANLAGEKPLSITVHYSSTEVFRLLKKGMDITAFTVTSNDEMSGVLMDGAIRGDIALLERLFNQGVSFNAKNKVGDTPLTLAAKYEQQKAVDFLIAAKASLEASGKNQRTALKWAAMKGSTEIASSLLQAKACIKAGQVDGSLALAMQGGQKAIVHLLLKNIRFPKEDDNPFKKNKLEKLLVNAIQANALFLATEVYKILGKLNLVQNGSIALFQAACNDHEQIVTFLLSANANLPGAVILAVKMKRSDVAARFIKNTDDENKRMLLINAEDDSKRTLLMLVIQKNDSGFAKELIDAKALIDSVDMEGMTPLMHALGQRNEEIAKFLLDKLANYRAKNIYQENPLMLAIRYDQIVIAQRILELLKERAEQLGLSACDGIDDNDFEGRTALILASIYGRLAIAKMLLDRGANAKLQTSKCKTALDCASKHGHAPIVEELLRIEHTPEDLMTALQHAVKAHEKLKANLCLMLNDKSMDQPKMKQLKVKQLKINQFNLIIRILLKKGGFKGNGPPATPRQNRQVRPPQLNRRRITWKTPLTMEHPPADPMTEQEEDSIEFGERKVEG